ncbi:MAG: hypothetical protein AAB774_00385 [Patescibacteria group bacterium]
MTDSLITDREAEEIVSLPSGVAAKIRTPLLVIFGILVVVIATLLVMVLLSLRGSRTGWESILPFLNQRSSQGLQTN